jgi:hypothetical protein
MLVTTNLVYGDANSQKGSKPRARHLLHQRIDRASPARTRNRVAVGLQTGGVRPTKAKRFYPSLCPGGRPVRKG